MDTQDIEDRLVAQAEGDEGGKDWEFGVSRYKLLYRARINKVLLYSTGNYVQYPVINNLGKECLHKISGNLNTNWIFDDY